MTSRAALTVLVLSVSREINYPPSVSNNSIIPRGGTGTHINTHSPPTLTKINFRNKTSSKQVKIPPHTSNGSVISVRSGRSGLIFCVCGDCAVESTDCFAVVWLRVCGYAYAVPTGEEVFWLGCWLILGVEERGQDRGVWLTDDWVLVVGET